MTKTIVPKTLLAVGTMIALALPAIAADPQPDQGAGKIEATMAGFWAPDREAMIKLFTDKGLKKEDAVEAVDESKGITLRIEKGKVFFYSRQGAIAAPYEIRKFDVEKNSITVAQAGADKQPVEATIKGDQLTVSGPMPFIFLRIEKEEFEKRIKDVPGHENPLEPPAN